MGVPGVISYPICTATRRRNERNETRGRKAGERKARERITVESLLCRILYDCPYVGGTDRRRYLPSPPPIPLSANHTLDTFGKASHTTNIPFYPIIAQPPPPVPDITNPRAAVNGMTAQRNIIAQGHHAYISRRSIPAPPSSDSQLDDVARRETESAEFMSGLSVFETDTNLRDIGFHVDLLTERRQLIRVSSPTIPNFPYNTIELVLN